MLIKHVKANALVTPLQCENIVSLHSVRHKIVMHILCAVNSSMEFNNMKKCTFYQTKLRIRK